MAELPMKPQPQARPRPQIADEASEQSPARLTPTLAKI
jgi:hypothetical protein